MAPSPPREPAALATALTQLGGVVDELHARCFVLDDGTTRIALVVSDNIYISREVLDDAKRQVTEATGLPADRMLMSGTHTHSSVSARWKNPLQPEKEFTEYQRFIAHRIADGVRCAINNLQPARVAWGTADLPGQVFCRRWLMKPEVELFNPFGEPDQAKMNPGNSPNLLKPAGPVDPQIAFLRCRRSTAGRSACWPITRCTTWAGPVPITSRPITSASSPTASSNCSAPIGRIRPLWAR